MTKDNNINNFSLISRLFGNLFYRSPNDPTLANVFLWLKQKGLSSIWCLELDKESQKALDNLQMEIDLSVLKQEYQTLFIDNSKVSIKISDYGISSADFLNFRAIRGMPLESADNFGLVFLTASWIEDNLDSVDAQKELFEKFLLPCASQFLKQVELKASLPFYKSLALLSREILSAMADELEEI
ncbi:TorA maturation chaperone TorD [Bisgaardia hudsonensis]|uniref:TorA maturation chaperone TorD n=1 Tax=Bisgaardia hudsonensis TaxID=109472 RepID=A0A4R2N1M1_9PAST|nr:molecular chaperone [Bisgaardia hudsonensis]QLB12998.1 hypothetical protein A6A11_04935 [Bisgaardia hudsonensis]TCP13438.1 TorA maturation chaperone TorD [Bisgaardia hudsonensis]